jgi:hypothetical protein
MSAEKDPMRLLLDPSCPESERALLRLGTSIAPPRGAEARVWQAVIGVVGAGSATGTTTVTSASKAEAAGVTGAKIAIVLGALAALAALAVLGKYLVTSSGHPQPPIAVTPPSVTPPPVSIPPAPVTSPPERAQPPVAASGPKSVRAKAGLQSHARALAAASPASRLREETGLISEARQALREGDAARALKFLEESRRRFPVGVLAQERERLTIEALVKSGRPSEASTRAAEFLRKNPDSPHAGAIRRLVEDATRSGP